MECQKTLETRVADFGHCGESSNGGMFTGSFVDTATILSRKPKSARMSVRLHHLFLFCSNLRWVGNTVSVSHDRLRMMASFLLADSKDALSTNLPFDQAQKVPGAIRTTTTPDPFFPAQASQQHCC
jgi:hypothetical protein